MGNATVKAISPADMLTVLDGLGKPLKAQWPNIGLGAPSESGTLAQKFQTAFTDVMGDGSATYGLANARIQKLLEDSFSRNVFQQRWDSIFQLATRDVFSTLDSDILATLPFRSSTDAWNFVGDGSKRPIDRFLARVNANDPSVPATPAYTLTLAATTGGSIAPTTAGAEPRCKITLVGANDWLESQPTAASAQAALTGAKNAWTLGGLTGNVPTGVTKLRVYRQLDNNAGSSDPYYWDQDVPVTAGNPWSGYTVTLKNADQDLRTDWAPPSWLSALILPESAMLLALSYAQSGQNLGVQGLLPILNDYGMISAGNVNLNPVYILAATPSYGFLGFNPRSTAEFARWVATAFTEGSVPTANVSAQKIQGYGGSAGGVRLRVVSALNANAPITNVTYYYYDAAHPTAIQNTTIASPGTLNLGQDQTLDLGITAGRLVTRVSAMTVGTAVTGTIICEGVPLRNL